MGKVPFGGPIKATTTWEKPHAWDRRAAENGASERVFTCSLSDFFHEGADAWRDDAWDVIRSGQNLDWLILTKRPENIRRGLPADWGDGYPNVWLGVTVEMQTNMRRVDILAKIPAVVRFVSAEPLLQSVNFGRRLAHVDWVITGCEQAHKDIRRPMNIDWVRDIRDECEATGIPLFHKQYYQGTQLVHDGLIDGVIHQGYPRSRAKFSTAE